MWPVRVFLTGCPDTDPSLPVILSARKAALWQDVLFPIASREGTPQKRFTFASMIRPCGIYVIYPLVDRTSYLPGRPLFIYLLIFSGQDAWHQIQNRKRVAIFLHCSIQHCHFSFLRREMFLTSVKLGV